MSEDGEGPRLLYQYIRGKWRVASRRHREMAGRWLGDGWEMAGRWSGDGREMAGRWPGDGREMAGRWSGDGREMVGRWSGDGREMVAPELRQSHRDPRGSFRPRPAWGDEGEMMARRDVSKGKGYDSGVGLGAGVGLGWGQRQVCGWGLWGGVRSRGRAGMGPRAGVWLGVEGCAKGESRE